ncbi:hypothetical protein R3P38DRAFT_2982287 [Favolaschia claudopus]|uniref:Transmembrane protein n=1 Tax=Favolaschia claudopus TaxID=2862362 RepID=A0AAW0AXM5_9AGAR
MSPRPRNAASETSSESGTPRIIQAGRYAAETAISTFHALNDAESHHIPGAPYSTVRHTRPWVYYQGISTVVPVSILGVTALPSDRIITLQRRGWRTGLLGWQIGGWLGGTMGKELDVTPASLGHWSTVDSKKRAQYDKEIQQFLDLPHGPGGPKDHRVFETDFVHIPVAAGDGYFRLLLKQKSGPGPSKILASTASFRVGSLSLSSAHPRGASAITILPEVVLKSASVTLTTAAWAGFYAAFPFLKLVGRWAMNRAYRLAGGDQTVEELKERYKVEERRMHMEESVYRNVPFGSVGVRTAYDLEEDARVGKGGLCFPREANRCDGYRYDSNFNDHSSFLSIFPFHSSLHSPTSFRLLRCLDTFILST